MKLLQRHPCLPSPEVPLHVFAIETKDGIAVSLRVLIPKANDQKVGGDQESGRDTHLLA